MMPKIGLALGGGGAKGLAHVGVLQVLAAENYPITYLAGTSIGALVGGLYALDGGIQLVNKLAAELDRKTLLSLWQTSISSKGIIGTKKTLQYIEQFTAGALVEDCVIPFTAVATDSNNGQVCRINQGSLAEAILASMAIPMLVTPVELQGRHLIDGGVSEPVPVPTVRAMGADQVIAVNLDGSYFPEESTNKKMNPFQYTKNTYNILKYYLSKYLVEEADLLLEPNVGDPGLLEFGNDRLIAAGHLCAESALPKLRALKR